VLGLWWVGRLQVRSAPASPGVLASETS
jgi:hypothetical protein